MNINFKDKNDLTAVLFLTSIFTLPRTYIYIKLFFLFLYIVLFINKLLKEKIIYVNKKIIIFYGLIILMGILWSAIGFINGGSIAGILDNFRLWVIWSICFIILDLMFLKHNSLAVFHTSIVLSGILISIINIIGFCDLFYGLNFLPESILNEMDLRLGIHEGYMHITTENITSLFFIVPYLIALQFRSDGISFNNWVVKVSLFLTFFLAIFSGRRALWICILLTPILILGWAFLLNSFKQVKLKYRRFSFLFFLGGFFFLGFIFTNDNITYPTLIHLKEAFSAEDERSIQKKFLVESFFEYPILGSGFGVGAGYQRSETRIWLYELTYHQLLFNFGIIGIIIIAILYLTYLYLIMNNIKYNKPYDLIPFCMLIGIVSFAIGAYSNPYFGSFDFLIYISMVPFLASFKILKE